MTKENLKITAKQIGVLYGASKRGEIKAESGFFSFLYYIVKSEEAYQSMYQDYSKENKVVRDAIDAYFAKDIEKAQKAISAYCESEKENLACYAK